VIEMGVRFPLVVVEVVAAIDGGPMAADNAVVVAVVLVVDKRLEHTVVVVVAECMAVLDTEEEEEEEGWVAVAVGMDLGPKFDFDDDTLEMMEVEEVAEGADVVVADDKYAAAGVLDEGWAWLEWAGLQPGAEWAG